MEIDSRQPISTAQLPAWRKSRPLKILLALLFIAGGAALYPIGTSTGMAVTEGSVWNRDDVIAEFSFPVRRNADDYKRAIDSALASVHPVFTTEVDDGITLALFDSTWRRAREHIAQRDTTGLSSALVEGVQLGVVSTHDAIQVQTVTREIVREGVRKGIVDGGGLSSRVITIRAGHAEREELVDSLMPIGAVIARTKAVVAHAPPQLSRFAILVVEEVVRPTVTYDSAATAADERSAIASVPRTKGIVARGERVAAHGDVVDASLLERLNAYEGARSRRGEERLLPRYLGAAMHQVLLLVMVLFYLFTLRRRLLADAQALLIVMGLVTLVGILAFASMRISGGMPMEYLILTPVAAMLATILYDSRTGFFVAVIASLLAAGVRGWDYSIAVTLLVAGGVAAYTVRDLRSRTQLFRSIGYIMLVYALSIGAGMFERATPASHVLWELSFAAVSAVISPVLTYALLIVMERGLNISTDLTYLEFDDINHPLLKLLSTETPGTFHHTMVIADMAERAADAIGANAILAKVGAYYHDIGKIGQPEFFIENQFDRRNKHERLAPLASARVIMQHVPDGLALAKTYGLPDGIADFIPMHHGTTTIAYFYDRAVRRRKREEVKVEDFTYPGPRPRSRETGIVMLADSVEATIRSLGSFDEATIESVVQRTIRNRFLEGQLDESDLTASDLLMIRDQFVEILIGIHHPRVKYPDDQREQQAEETSQLPTESGPIADAPHPADTHQDGETGPPVDNANTV
jgi:putative nucleotidyltransferase with HDIG domain